MHLHCDLEIYPVRSRSHLNPIVNILYFWSCQIHFLTTNNLEDIMINLYLHCDLSLEGKVRIFLMVIHWLTMWMHIPRPTVGIFKTEP